MSLPVIMLEYRPVLCPEPDPRAFARRTLRRLGYVIDPIFHENPFEVGMLWAPRLIA